MSDTQGSCLRTDWHRGAMVQVVDRDYPRDGVVIGPSKKNSAEFEVSISGVTWDCHWAYIRAR